MIELAQQNRNINFIFMHNIGIPADKNNIINENTDVISEISTWLENKLNILEKSNIGKEQIIFDVGIGFGKNQSQNLQILQRIEYFHKYNVRLLVGHSRKSFMKIFRENADRDVETIAISMKLCEMVDILRVHTPLEHQRAILASKHILNQFI